MSARLRLASAGTLAFVFALALRGPAASPVDPPIVEAAVALHASAKAAPDKVTASKLAALATDLDRARDLAARGNAAEGEALARATLTSLKTLTSKPGFSSAPYGESAARAAAILGRALGMEPPPPVTPPGPTGILPVTGRSIPVPTAKPGTWLDRVVGSVVRPPAGLPAGLIERPKIPPLALGTNVFVAEPGWNRITLINQRLGVKLSLPGNPGTQDRFALPAAVAVDSRGRIYVADTDNHRIVRVNSMEGDCWVAFGRRGAGPYQLNNPRGIAFDSAGRIYIADSDNHRIVRIDDMAGANWVTFGSEGGGVNQFQEPWGVFVDRRDAIVVADTLNNRVARFTSMTGAGWTTCCGDAAAATGPFPTLAPDVILTPTAIAEDRDGKYYVTSSLIPYRSATFGPEDGHRIVRIDDLTGRGMTSLGGYGAACDGSGRVASAAERRFHAPSGVAIAPDGHLFVADTFNQRVIETNGIDGAGWRVAAGGGAVGASCHSGGLYYPMGMSAPGPARAAPTTCEPVACPPYQKTCDGRCVNIDDPRYGCSPTGCSACALQNVANPTCTAANRCDYDRCFPQRATDLDGNRENGCELANANLFLWLDATTRVHTLPGAQVSMWGDRTLSNAGVRLTGQLASSSYSPEWPTYEGATPGAPVMPSVRFGATSGGHHSSLHVRYSDPGGGSASPIVSLSGKPYTILAVVQRASNRNNNDFLVGSGRCGLFGCDNGSTLLVGWSRDDEACVRQWNDDICLRVPRHDPARPSRTLFVATNDGTTKTLLYKPAGAPASSTDRAGGGLSTGAGLSIGGVSYGSAPETWFDGNVFEVIVYDAVIPPALLATMRSYLERKYGL